MKRILLILICCIVVTGCMMPQNNANQDEEQVTEETINSNKSEESSSNDSSSQTADEELESNDDKQSTLRFGGLDDPELLTYLDESLYAQLVADLGDDFFVENVSSTYVSKEYLEDLAHNNQSNVFFGFSLEELNNEFGEDRYVFSLGEDGSTIVTKLDTEYDDTFEKTIKNVAVGGGVILICATVSPLVASASMPISMILACSAKGGMALATSSAVIGFVSTSLFTAYQTGDVSYALKEAVYDASNGFKLGAIIGALLSGGKEFLALKGATLNGLSMAEAAMIQKESKWPLQFIKSLHSVEEYSIYKAANLQPVKLVDGTYALIREIDWTIVDEIGRTNVQRVLEGLAPLDALGKELQLHHIGQKVDSPLAILTFAEHMLDGHNKILHYLKEGIEHGAAWEAQKDDFWLMILQMAQGG